MPDDICLVTSEGGATWDANEAIRLIEDWGRAAEARGREQAAKIAECPRYKDGALAAKDSDYYRYGQHIAAAIRALAR